MIELSPSALLQSGLVLGGVGLVFGALIAVAHRYLHVWEDPRIDGVTEILPGSNCGACGFAGCRSFAEGLVGGGAQPATCTQMTPEAIAEVADYLGVEAGTAVRRTARLLCAGGLDVAPRTARYVGLSTCAAADRVAGGGKACPWGCLGLGDCVDVCNDDAIALNRVELPVVEPSRCTACGKCVDACPRDLLELLPVDRHLLVQCKSALEGDDAEALCAVACTACGKCALDAPEGVIAMAGGLAVIDPLRAAEAGPEATARCPTGAIAWVDGRQRLARRAPALQRVPA